MNQYLLNERTCGFLSVSCGELGGRYVCRCVNGVEWLATQMGGDVIITPMELSWQTHVNKSSPQCLEPLYFSSCLLTLTSLWT